MMNDDTADDLSFEALTFGTDDNDKIQSNLSDTKEDDEKGLEKEGEPERRGNVVLITTDYGAKLNVQEIVKAAEEMCGKVKYFNFRDKQCFGFLQFEESEDVERALDKLNELDVDGAVLNAYPCAVITPGRDPRTHDFNSEFKTSTLVFKNLPFQLKQEKLEEMLSQFKHKPQNVSYLYDASGMFRGMAFVKYKEIEHGTVVFEAMNGIEINGRKLRIEYKRKVREVEAPPEDDAKLVEQINSFKAGSLTEIAFPCSSSLQRKQIHHIADKFGLGHYSTGEGENKYVLVKKKDTDSQLGSSPSKSPSSATLSSSLGKGQPIKAQPQMKRRPSGTDKHSYPGKSPPSPGHPLSWSEKNPYGNNGAYNNKISKSVGSSLTQHIPIKSPPTALSPFGTSPTYKKSAAILNRPESAMGGILRQPKGPDGTNGFSTEYRNSRQKTFQP